MPRDNNGVVTMPNGTYVQVDETIEPSQHNPAFRDVAEMLTDSLSRTGRGPMLTNLPMNGFRVTDLAPGVNPTDAVTVGQLDAKSGLPVGAVTMWLAAQAPQGWLTLSGQMVSRTQYPTLFALIGYTFGGSGNTFALPDLRGRVVAGHDTDRGGFADRLTTPNSRDIGAAGGVQSVVLNTSQMPSHAHGGFTNASGEHTHTTTGFLASAGSGPMGARLEPGTMGAGFQTGTSGLHLHAIGAEGGGQAHANVQPVIVLNFIVKASEV